MKTEIRKIAALTLCVFVSAGVLVAKGAVLVPHYNPMRGHFDFKPDINEIPNDTVRRRPYEPHELAYSDKNKYGRIKDPRKIRNQTRKPRKSR